MYTRAACGLPKLIKPFPLEKVRILVIQFIFCSLAFIVCGTVFFTLSYKLREPDDLIELLQTLPGFNLNSCILTRGVCAIQILLGCVGILVHCFGYAPKILCSFPSGIRIPFGLLALAAYESAQIGIRNFDDELQIIANREVFYYTHREILKPISNDNLLIKRFQEKFQCCGKESPRDWFLSSCACLPLSCCKPKKYKVCRDAVIHSDTGASKNLTNFSFNVTNPKDLPYWNKGCHQKVMKVLSRIGFNTGSFAASIFTFHLVLSIWMTHIIQLIFHLFDSREGYAQLQIFRGKCPSKSLKIQDAFKSFVRAMDPLSADLSEEQILRHRKNDIQDEEDKQLEENESFPESSADSGKTSILFEKEKGPSKNKEQ